MIRAPFVAGIGPDAWLDPASRVWRGSAAAEVQLIGTPLGMQPTESIRVAWRDRPIGAVERVSVAALHNGRELAFRLSWRDPDENLRVGDNDQFPDAAAVLFPSVEHAPLVTMGAPGMAVNAWYWRADEPDAGRQVVAEGIGTSRTVDRALVRARGVWKEGRWRVVIGRALRVAGGEPVVQLREGARVPVGLAVWEGGHGERGGIKAFSPGWPSLELARAPSARR